jgi:UDP-2,4-diacetamido-2,4,6-trideoxy-beta-L-altropyranose hydrolase
MPQAKVYFRTDANPSIGMGHLIRCTALAEMLKEKFSITFLLASTPSGVRKKFIPTYFQVSDIVTEEFSFLQNTLTEKDILVLDGYDFDSAYQRRVKSTGVRLAYIDDLRSFEYYADLIINQADQVSESDYKIKSQARFCLGPSFALLRQPFLKATQIKREVPSKITSVFVSFGGADLHNITEKVLKALTSFDTLENIHVLTGPVNLNVETWKEQFKNSSRIHFHNNLSSEQVCELMSKCQLGLAPASSLSLELCAVGLVLLVGITADNQKGYYKGLTEKSAALGIGDWQSVTEEDLVAKLNGILIYDAKDISWFIKNQRQYIDGLSAERLQKAFLELAA